MGRWVCEHAFFPVRRHLRGWASVRWQSTLTSAADVPSPAHTSTAVEERKAHWLRTRKSASQADSVLIHVRAGAGGDGCVAFHREMGQMFAKPAGAAGGSGGSVLIQASAQVASLARLPIHLNGHRGSHGLGNWSSGRAGADKTIVVPVGTVVRVMPVKAEDSLDTVKAQRMIYERRLMLKYRTSFQKQYSARVPAWLLADAQEEEAVEYTPDELRAHRDATWRYYVGKMSHDTSADSSTKESSRLTRKERKLAEQEREKIGEAAAAGEEDIADKDVGAADVDDKLFTSDSLEVAEAESDIRDQGRALQLAEQRYAFTLLSDLVNKGRVLQHDADIVEESDEWTMDLDDETSEGIMLAAGGKGGLGNAFFASEHNRSPTFGLRGLAGSEAMVSLEWKFKGDVGLIGLPNAGKSTFLRAVSATGDDVRIAGYAFTTLSPNVGVVRLGESGLLGVRGSGPIEESKERILEADPSDERHLSRFEVPASESVRRVDEMETTRFVLQDLPGLVRGASYNRGLGHDFLKHVERCFALYYVLDVSDDAKTPWEDLRLVFDELEAYRPGLSDKVQGVIANKCDAIHIMEQAQQQESETEAAIDGRRKLQLVRQEAGRLHGRTIPVWNISAKHRLGVERTARAMASTVEVAKRKAHRELGSDTS